MRRTTLAAVALVCGITCVGGLASAGTAYAAPEPAPTTSAPATPGTPEEDAAEGELTTPTALEEVRKKIEKLYHRASVATDAYNAAEEKAERQAKEVARLERAVARGQDRLTLLRHGGATAREQYRSGGIPEGAQFLLSDDPRLFLDNANRFQRGQHAAKGLMSQLRTTQEQLEKDEAAASAEYKKLERHRASKAKAKKEIKKQIKAAEELEKPARRRGAGAAAEAGGGGAAQGAERLGRLRHPRRDLRQGLRRRQEGPGVRGGADRQAVLLGRRGPRLLRLLRADLPGVGVRRSPHPAHLPGAVAPAGARPDTGDAPGRPDHLPRRRQPRRYVRGRRQDRARPASGLKTSRWRAPGR